MLTRACPILTGHPWPIKDGIGAQKSGIGALRDLGFSGCDVSLMLVWRMTGSQSSVIISTPLIAPHSHCVHALVKSWVEQKGLVPHQLACPIPSQMCTLLMWCFSPWSYLCSIQIMCRDMWTGNGCLHPDQRRTGVHISPVLSRCMHSQWQPLLWWGQCWSKSLEKEPAMGQGGTEVVG